MQDSQVEHQVLGEERSELAAVVALGLRNGL